MRLVSPRRGTSGASPHHPALHLRLLLHDRPPTLLRFRLALQASQRLPSLTDQEHIALDDCFSSVTCALAKCERLLRTPIPLGYTRYSVRFIWLW